METFDFKQQSWGYPVGNNLSILYQEILSNYHYRRIIPITLIFQWLRGHLVGIEPSSINHPQCIMAVEPFWKWRAWFHQQTWWKMGIEATIMGIELDFYPYLWVNSNIALVKIPVRLQWGHYLLHDHLLCILCTGLYNHLSIIPTV